MKSTTIKVISFCLLVGLLSSCRGMSAKQIEKDTEIAVDTLKKTEQKSSQKPHEISFKNTTTVAKGLGKVSKYIANNTYYVSVDCDNRKLLSLQSLKGNSSVNLNQSQTDNLINKVCSE